MAESSDYTPIVTYKSETAGALPPAENLRVGELAVNIADAILYTKDSDSNIVAIGFGQGVVTEAETLIEYLEDFYNNDETFNDYITNIVNNEIITANRPGVIETAATAYTISADDETNLIRFSSDSPVTVTVPADSSENLPIGFITHLHQGGLGQVTVVGEGSVEVNSSRSLVTDRQYSALSLFKLASDDWTLVGDQQ
jgi:hypothetical protein